MSCSNEHRYSPEKRANSFYRIPRHATLIAALCIATIMGRCDAKAVDVFTAPPFAIDLWPDAGPQERLVVNDESPIVIRSALGETTSALIAIRFELAAETTSIEPPDFGDHISIKARIVSSARRATAYTGIAGLRYPERFARETGMALPDVLHSDERVLIAAMRDWPGLIPSAPRPNMVVIAPVEADNWKYVLLTVEIAENAEHGIRNKKIKVTADGREQMFPIDLHIRPFILSRDHGRLVGISNEFCDPGNPLMIDSLELMRDLCLTFTRITPITNRVDSDRWFGELRRHGLMTLSINRPPLHAEELRRIPQDFRVFFYGVDEPQPKDRHRRDWSRMAEHIRLAGRLRDMGAKVMTSIPYPLAMELRNQDSRLYREVAALGIGGIYAPLDWANVGLGIQRLGRDQLDGDDNQELFEYIKLLQIEFDEKGWADNAQKEIKHPWIETYYFPHGMSRYPAFGRLLFGFYLFNSRLDGAMAWTMYRVPNGNPLTEADEPVATLAYPGMGELHGTYSLEALREGVNDLRYAQQAYLAVNRCLANDNTRDRGNELRERFNAAMSPYMSLMPEGKRIDLSIENIESAMQETREELARIIIEANSGEASPVHRK